MVTIDQQFIIADEFKFSDTINHSVMNPELAELLKMKQFYVERDEQFNMDNFEKLWKSFNLYAQSFNKNEFLEWIETSGLLLELTGEVSYSEALQNIIDRNKFNLTEDIVNMLKTYIYTKNVDHIQLNLFVNSALEYKHTLGGNVKIIQENDIEQAGKVILTFEMEENRYIELFVRIPSWANGATVTVKNVKYVAPPGDYCQIAKKWKNGDRVEIVLPVERRPK